MPTSTLHLMGGKLDLTRLWPARLLVSQQSRVPIKRAKHIYVVEEAHISYKGSCYLVSIVTLTHHLQRWAFCIDEYIVWAG